MAIPAGSVSLKDICNGKIEPQILGEVNLSRLIDFIIRGGWPANQDAAIKTGSISS